MESLHLICFCTKEDPDSKQMSNEICTSWLLIDGYKDPGDGGTRTEPELHSESIKILKQCMGSGLGSRDQQNDQTHS